MAVYEAPGEEEEECLVAPELRLEAMLAGLKGTYLMWAAQQGSLATVEALVQSGADVNEAGHRGSTALHYAAMKGQEVLVAVLLSKGAWAGTRDADGRTAFTWAAQYGHVNVAQRLVEHLEGQWLDEMDRQGWTPLMYAAEAGHDAMATFLLERHAQANVRGDRGKTALRLARENGHFGLAEMLERHMEREDVKQRETQRRELKRAVLEGDEERVGALLRDGAPVSMRDEAGMTPLMLACERERVGVAIRLLEHSGRAGIDERDQDGRTALHVAAERGHPELVDLLLTKGAQASLVDATGITPLTLACQGGRLDVASLLVEHMEAQWLDKTDHDGRTALHHAAECGSQAIVGLLLNKGAQACVEAANGDTPLVLACSGGHMGVANLLVDHMEGQWLDKTGNLSGRTVLHHAAEGGREELVDCLLNRGAHASPKDRNGKTPLMLACWGNRLGVVDRLARDMNPQELNERDGQGWTALHYAAGHGSQELVDLLLSKGAQACIVNPNGDTPLTLACWGGHVELATLLVDHMEGQWLDKTGNLHGSTALHYAAGYGFEELADRLLNKGAQASPKDRNGKTPFMLACRGGHPGVMQRLGRDMDPHELNERDGQGRTALHYAAEGGHQELVNILLSKGAQACVVDANGGTPLTVACRGGHLELANLLVDHTERQWLDKADQNGQTRTALHYAAERGHEEMVDRLLKKGAQASPKDRDGKTPLMLACPKGHRGVVQRLVRHMKGRGLDERDTQGRTALHWAAVAGRLRDSLSFVFGAQPAAGPSYPKVVRRLLVAGADPTLACYEGATPRQMAERLQIPQIVAEFDRWPDVLKSLTLQRARWLQDVTSTHAHDPTAPLPGPSGATVLAARVADGRALPRLEMATGQAGEEGQDFRALVEFLVVRVPDKPFREIMGML